MNKWLRNPWGQLEVRFVLGYILSLEAPFLCSLQAYERQIPPRAVINSAGYKVLTSVDQYLELVGNSLPGKEPVVSSHMSYVGLRIVQGRG